MKKLLALTAVLVAFLGLSAQQLDPVKWSYSVKETSPNAAELIFTAKLDAGWHLYSQYTDPNGPLPINFEFTESADYQREGKVLEPKPHEEMDEIFQCVVKSFSGTVVFRQKIKRLSEKDFTVKGVLNYQLCNDGSCIAPEDRDFAFKVKGAEQAVVEALAAVDEIDAIETIDSMEVAGASETELPVEEAAAPEEEKRQSLLWIFLIALGGGILTMFTPCVFPMIPMTVNFFMHGSDNKRKNRRQAWFFGFSIVFIFAVLGAVLALILGPESLYTLGTHWIPNLIFFVIFFTFALSFFGLFEIKMPEKWVNASDEQADKGGFLAPFFIALTTVLVSFSCTGPILGAALVVSPPRAPTAGFPS